MTRFINTKELSTFLKKENTVTLIDVRRKTDYEASPQKITDAQWYDPENIDTWIKQLPVEKLTIAYCVKGGPVSQSVVDRLQQNGMEAVFLEGGIKAWIENGQPIENIPAPKNEYRIQETDVDLLRKAGLCDEDLAHSMKVAEKALEIAARTGILLDMELVGRGALFHDLGKARTHAMEHGKLGAEMGLAMGLPKSITDVMEKHIRGGLSQQEVVELGLPVKDYTLGKLEERIIIYADRLVDIITEGIVPIKNEKEAEQRFEEILKTIPKYGKNDITLERYLGYHREIQHLAAI
ncbi:MAG: HDIG domain-containing protein [Desulfobacula sp.]|uniref:HDIG domain-containing metalloprotein n=1 Tax=Desulfobacula sp. TaxID=2593537 RepID=UPI001D89D14A|nr:HDIG domain-containing protein [Desulfobacula sp.]MBT6751994.1 HDIG domain-containing protein [Desulfobacula sp.]MBT7261019.1 HDIG domain-containing protein [Desulfobacula sp.]